MEEVYLPMGMLVRKSIGEEEEGDGEAEDGNKDEETEAPMSKQVAEDDGDNDVDTKKQKVIEDD